MVWRAFFRQYGVLTPTMRRLAASRRLRIGATLAVVVVAGSLTFWIAADDGMPAPTAETSGVTIAPPPALRQAGATSDAGAASESAPLVASSGSERVEVCGVGWVDAQADGSVDPTVSLDTPALEAARRALVDSLRNGGDDFGFAASLVLEMSGAVHQEDRGRFSRAFCRAPQCDSTDADRRFAFDRLEQLARLAVATSDPLIYALAYRTCSSALAPGSCALLNAAQWARLDDGNAAPWLFILNDAAARVDVSQVNEALYRIGAARRFDDRAHVVAGLIVDHSGTSDVELGAAQELVVMAIGLSAAQSLAVASLTRACNGQALAGAERRQLCDAAAATLADRSDSMFLSIIGAAIGRRVGWKDERIDAVRALQDAASDAWAVGPRQDPLRFELTCDEVRRGIAHVQRAAKLGEPGFVREWLVANGKDIAPYAKRAHDGRIRSEAEESARQALRGAALPPPAATPAASEPR